MVFRVRLLVAVALPLAAADLLHKLVDDTQDWAYHPRGSLWVVLVTLVALGCVVLTRIPSLVVAVFAGVLAAGAIGNGVAALAWEEGVPNPLVVRSDTHIAAFNVADVLTIFGIAGLTVALIAVTIANRAILPPPRRVARILWAKLR